MIARRSRQLRRLAQLEGRALATARDLLVRATPAALSERQLDDTLDWRPPVA